MASIGKRELEGLQLTVVDVTSARGQRQTKRTKTKDNREARSASEPPPPAQASADQVSPHQSLETSVPEPSSPTFSPPQSAGEGEPAPTSSTETGLRDCDICGDSSPASDLPAHKGCPRHTKVCRDCLAHWIAHKVDNWFEMQGKTCPCLVEGCPGAPTLESAKQSTTPELFER
jgi:hypothetical protein